MSQLQNKNVRKLKNIVHIAVHFPIIIIIIIIIITVKTPVNTYVRMSQVFCMSRGSDIIPTSDRQQQQNLIERMNLSSYYYSDLQVVNANLGRTDQHLRVNCFK